MKKLLIPISFILLISCVTSPSIDKFRPSSYGDFVFDAFKSYWMSLDMDTTINIDPSKWKTFQDAQNKLQIYDIDFYKEFIVRTLQRDKLWVKYTQDRTEYEADHPGKSYKDQIVEIIANYWKSRKGEWK